MLQDGTNNILENGKSADEIFQGFEKLIFRCMDKFEPENSIFCY